MKIPNASEFMLPKPKPPEWYAVQERLFRDAVKPIQRMKARIYSLYLPTVILDSGGNLIKSAYPDEALVLIEQLDKMIQQAADSWPRS